MDEAWRKNIHSMWARTSVAKDVLLIWVPMSKKNRDSCIVNSRLTQDVQSYIGYIA